MERQQITRQNKITPQTEFHPTRKSHLSNSSTVHPIRQLHDNIGNQAMQKVLGSQNIQNRLNIGRPGDKYEREADRTAADVLRIKSDFPMSPPPQMARGLSSPLGNPKIPDAKPLPDSVRRFFEPRFGVDLSHIRIHTGRQAALMADSLSARSFTTGSDIVFAPQQYSPHSGAGRDLLAHELVHTVQQGATALSPNLQMCNQMESAPSIQRQVSDKKSQITVLDIFPLAEGDKFFLSSLLPERLFATMAAQQKKEIAASKLSEAEKQSALEQIENMTLLLKILQALEQKDNRQAATVTTANENELTATIPGPVSVSGAKGSPPRTFHDITFMLRRAGNGTFNLVLSTKEKGELNPIALLARRNLTAARRGKDGKVVFSSPGIPEKLQVAGGSQDEKILSVLQPVKVLGEVQIKVLKLKKLGNAKTPPKQIDAAIKQVIATARRSRKRKNNQIRLEAGILSPMLAAAWELNFPIGTLSQVPVEARLQYVPEPAHFRNLLSRPTGAVTGSLSTGVGIATPAELNLPVNLRIDALAGGAFRVPTSKPSTDADYGISLGARLGIGFGSWRLNVRGDYLLNLAGNSSNIARVDLALSKSFDLTKLLK